MRAHRPASLLLAAALASAWAGLAGSVPTATRAGFPPGSTGYHTYAEIRTDVRAVAAAHPAIVRTFSIGKSAQARDLLAAEVTTSELPESAKPGVLFDGGIHGAEHLGPEAALALLHWLADGYGSDARITRLVRTRSIFIIFELNPDGLAYDISGGRYHEWRRNRQTTPGTTAIGTDVNRNFGYRWGCCGQTSSNPRSGYFRGPKAFSTPEASALRDFVASRVINGKQQIRGYVSFHTFGRLVLWPYGYTKTDRTPDMSVDDHAVLVALGRGMGTRAKYKAEQGSDFSVDSGTSRDWAYGKWKILSFIMELGVWDNPGDWAIKPETNRIRPALLWFIDEMGCPYALIGKAATHCS